MYNPIATYRIQFQKEFTFGTFESLLTYFKQLGVSTIYASPIFKAVPGSMHGYDVLDANEINEEIGDKRSLESLTAQLKAAGIGWLQDIVPNHMAYDTRNNWVMDMLEKGSQSIYAGFFDETWSDPMFKGRIMVPFLGSSIEEVIGRGELQLVYEDVRLLFAYFDSRYPLSPRSYISVLQNDKAPAAIQQLLLQIPRLKEVEEQLAYATAWNEMLLQLSGMLQNDEVHTYLAEALKKVNSSSDTLMQISEEQHYRLCHWQEANQRINYRRFFTVNGLICLNMADKNVFDQHHALIFELVSAGTINGLRVDHIDGLYNPSEYLNRLRKAAGPDTYIAVEKILETKEALPDSWRVQGATGYEFLSFVNNLLTNPSAEKAFTNFYNSIVPSAEPIEQTIWKKKQHILYQHMNGELENLYQLFMNSNLVNSSDYAQMRTEDIRTAIAAFLIHCPVYRYYGNQLPFDHEEENAVRSIFLQIKENRPDLAPAANLIENVLLQRTKEHNDDYNQHALAFYLRCMQLAGPLMAKGVEDTLMYTYNRFVAHNEVGDSPENFGLSVAAFHNAILERREHWPLALNATATHDTKRGEDVRARLNVLSDMPVQWIGKVKEWMQMNAALKQNGMPSANDEYFIYQTLAGSFPMPSENTEDYSKRLVTYLEKALREGKERSDWATPDTTYESATKAFAEALLRKSNSFFESFRQLQTSVIDFGIVNSLAQTILKFTCPGVPDVYQGCELWDLSLVDPDNRRAVDYVRCQQLLEEIEEKKGEEKFQSDLWENRYSGQIKLWVTQKLMKLRSSRSQLFTYGDYVPLKTSGTYSDNLIAYARRYKDDWLLVVLPLHLASIDDGNNFQTRNWLDTAIILPEGSTGKWVSVFDNTTIIQQNKIEPALLFQKMPFAVLHGKSADNERGAGILLHVSSLPGDFGIGDLGPAAYKFADFLKRSGQKYWQMLPLNPTEAGQGHSPYSAVSSIAGNPLFISPELLVQDGFLSEKDVEDLKVQATSVVDFEQASAIKFSLIEKAYQYFFSGENEVFRHDFDQFCVKENDWLYNYALYTLIKQKQNGKPWYEWPQSFKDRDASALSRLEKQNSSAIELVKWSQFIFQRQWRSLKQYCNNGNIQLVGDLPFYVSYDSADVWAHREIFLLDTDGKPLGMAGVPADAFSEDGQLWGMPVYNWTLLQQKEYKWWIERLKKNIELFDIIRLDHFRAFEKYWQVPAGAETAREGTWKEGPSADFFQQLKTSIPDLPFVAEDLGDVDEKVFALRDEFHLPGMKVLQFAFGENMATSDYIPHNYDKNFFVYTGTHDNNTALGWYQTEIDDETKNRLQQYAGRSIKTEELTWFLCQLAFASVAKVSILPIQDVLNLGADARMNMPASTTANWSWRLLPEQITTAAENRLLSWTTMYNRL